MNLRCSSVGGGEGTLENCGPGGQEQQRDKEGGGRKLILGFKDLIWWSWNFARQLQDVQTKRERREVRILSMILFSLWLRLDGGEEDFLRLKILFCREGWKVDLFLQRNCVYAARLGRG